MKTHHQKLFELAARPQGVTKAETRDSVHRTNRNEMSALMVALAESGDLFTAKHRKLTRYFTTPEAARAWEANPVETPKPVKVAATSIHGHRNPHVGPPKETIAEPFVDTRFAVDPATRFIGGFQSMGIGRYLDGNA